MPHDEFKVQKSGVQGEVSRGDETVARRLRSGL